MSFLSSTERHRETLRLLQHEGHVTVSDLSNRLNVSEVTVRKDLRYLEGRKSLIRVHGGAMLIDHVVFDLPLEAKAEQRVDEKRRIGAAAAGLVERDDRIILDSGSTTLEVARNLRSVQHLIAATSSISIARELSRNPGIELLMLGGVFRPNSASIVGPYAEQMLGGLTFRKLFLAGDGFDLHFGLSTTNDLEAQLNRVMIQAAQQTVVVTDSSKFGRRGLSRICGVETVHRVITDDKVPEHVVQSLEDLGIEVLAV